MGHFRWFRLGSSYSGGFRYLTTVLERGEERLHLTGQLTAGAEAGYPGCWGTRVASMRSELGRGNGTLTYHPLDPDHIIGAGLWAEVLQPTAEVVPHPLALFPQVGLSLGQEVLCHVHHVHHLEERQEQALGDPPNASATVQGTGSPRLVWAFLKHRGST